MEVVINNCYGGFGLSLMAQELYLDKKGLDVPDEKRFMYFWEIKRDDPILVEIVKELKDKAGSKYSILKIVSIPDDVEWEIQEYDGLEWISEKHRVWR